MYGILGRRVTSHAFDEMVCWLIGVLFLVGCSILTAKMTPELGRPVVVVLWTSVTVGWGVLAWVAFVIGYRLTSRSRL